MNPVRLWTAAALSLSGVASGASLYTPPQYTRAVPGPYGGPTRASAWVATPTRSVSARIDPTPRSRSLAVLRPRTPARNVARFLVTESRRIETTVWVRVLLSGGDAPVTGWIPAGTAVVHRTTTRIEIRLRTHSLVMFRAGRQVRRTWVATGRQGTPTPTGQFAVREVVRHGRQAARAIGPASVALMATTPMPNDLPSVDHRLAIIGLGRNSKRLLQRDSTLGSVRVANGPLAQIALLARAGTPVVIRAE